MHEDVKMKRGVLYVITCASGVAPRVYDFVPLAQAAGWNVCVILTPHARKFVDASLLQQITEHPVRSEYKHPSDPDVLPRADAFVVFPTTFNTLNKWALGISDTLAVGLLCEYTGLKIPIVAIPCVGAGLDNNQVFFRSMRMLKKQGIHFIYDPQAYSPGNKVPLSTILTVLHEICSNK